MLRSFVHNFKLVIIAFVALITFFIPACNNPADNRTPVVEELPSEPKSDRDIENTLTKLGVEINDWMEDRADKPLTDEEFFALAEEFGFPIDNEEELDSSGCEGEAVAPPLSSSCSISYSDSDPAYDYYGYTSASCYNYYSFPGDSESDCYIKFRNYWPGSYYYYGITNSCAAAASVYYYSRQGFISAYDTSSYVYMRLDRRWCESSNCEDGFKIY